MLSLLDIVELCATNLSGKLLEEALNFCKAIGIYPDYVNEDYRELPFKTCNKIYADYYIDDRAIGCPVLPNYTEQIDWNIILEKIKNEW